MCLKGINPGFQVGRAYKQLLIEPSGTFYCIINHVQVVCSPNHKNFLSVCVIKLNKKLVYLCLVMEAYISS